MQKASVVAVAPSKLVAVHAFPAPISIKQSALAPVWQAEPSAFISQNP